MNCVFTTGAKGSLCQRGCGRALAVNFRDPPLAYCTVSLPGDVEQSDSDESLLHEAQLGDALESFLTSHGITKEWYIDFKKEHGLPPTCDCDARQEWLNKTAAAHPTIANIGVQLLAAITRKKP